MKGDFTRFTYDPSKQYSGVLMQQGRVQVDADWNEQLEIQQGRERQTSGDVIGDAGLSWSKDPENPRDSLAVSVTSSTISVAPGRAYVDGIPVEVATEEGAPLDLTAQPWLPDYTLPTGTTTRHYVVYLDVWERHVDAVEDADIREIALGGPDTATRKQVVWQVKVLRLDTSTTTYTRTGVLGDTNWRTLIAGPTGTLTVRTTADGSDEDPCEVPEEGGYSGLENQLYRVEMHTGGFRLTNGVLATTGVPTSFLWCRENGSVTTTWEGQEAGATAGQKKLKVASTGRDENLGFKVGQWVELTDQEHELLGQAGTLAQIVDVDEESITIDTATATATHEFTDFVTAPRVRRWSSAGTTGAQLISEVDTTDADGDWIKLDYLQDAVTLFEGVEVQFDTTATYRPGDYWIIPARSISGELGVEENTPLPPDGPVHHHLMLAVVRRSGSTWSFVSDLRQRVVPLNEHIHLFMEGGDGQSGMPEGWLRAPLRVGVSNGLWPVPNAIVRFTIEEPDLSAASAGGLEVVPITGAGTYDADSPPSSTASTTTEVYATTDARGIAQVWWYLGVDPTDTETNAAEFLHQRVKAELVTAHVDYEAGTEPLHLVTHFTANPSVARDVAWDGDCTHLSGADTVTEAIELLCENDVLSYVAGDGQSGLPGAILPVPLTVRVGNGDWGAAGVRVRFSVTDTTQGGIVFLTTPPSGSWVDVGTLQSATPGAIPPFDVITLLTNASGLASVHVQLGDSATIRNQQIKCSILNDSGVEIGVTLIFNASILSSHGVRHAASCTHLASAFTVFEALELLCQNRSMTYVAGDAQHGKSGAVLSLALRARVANGVWPVAGATVQFEILNTAAFGTTLDVTQSGMLHTTSPGSVGFSRTPSTGAPWAGVWWDKFNVVTDANGEAVCQWRLGTYGGLEVQRVRATLMNGTTATPLAITYSAVVVSRPIETDQILAYTTTGYSYEAISPGQVIQWYEFFGLRFRRALIDLVGTGALARTDWYRCLDVEVEYPEEIRTAGSTTAVTRMSWIRLAGTFTYEDETLVWRMDRGSDFTFYGSNMSDYAAPLDQKLLMKVILKPTLIPDNLGRGSHDIETRYWLDFSPIPIGRPDRPGPVFDFDPTRFDPTRRFPRRPG